MAAAKNYILTFAGLNTKRSYSISGFTADTAGVVNTLNPNGAAVAASLNYWRPPENVVLVDFSMTTGTTQTSGYLTQDGAIKAGCVLDYVTYLSTNASRPKLNVPFPAGCLIGAVTI